MEQERADLRTSLRLDCSVQTPSRIRIDHKTCPDAKYFVGLVSYISA